MAFEMFWDIACNLLSRIILWRNAPVSDQDWELYGSTPPKPQLSTERGIIRKWTVAENGMVPTLSSQNQSR